MHAVPSLEQSPVASQTVQLQRIIPWPRVKCVLTFSNNHRRNVTFLPVPRLSPYLYDNGVCLPSQNLDLLMQTHVLTRIQTPHCSEEKLSWETFFETSPSPLLVFSKIFSRFFVCLFVWFTSLQQTYPCFKNSEYHIPLCQRNLTRSMFPASRRDYSDHHTSKSAKSMQFNSYLNAYTSLPILFPEFFN